MRDDTIMGEGRGQRNACARLRVEEVVKREKVVILTAALAPGNGHD